ncbi:GPI transamidase subunit PIG-U, putative [Plasmodium ovale curtisi]|uniref:GPI transamidase subunit PIG-U, putative n=1 Tax=Plasmodium ovale curtisi TaxID=864141 RepID=A0A1A8W338_PLAOA|nr:GPI transamidase subunit PIG-U, putative [Plasmodium ovale curtisi]
MSDSQGCTPHGDKRKRRYAQLFVSLVICVAIRIGIYCVVNMLEGSNYGYINRLIYIDENIDKERNNEVNKSLKMEKTNLNVKDSLNEMREFFQKNKRNVQLKKLLFHNDSIHFSFNSDIYNMKYIYDSYILRKMKKDVYSSYTIRVNPLFLLILHYITFTKIPLKFNTSISYVLNDYEYRYYLIISMVDLLIAIFLFLLIEKIKEKKDYFSYIYIYETNKWKIISSIVLINIYLNNPLTILSNTFLSLDNIKLLLITISFYLTILRIHNISNVFFSIFHILIILFLNAILLYITSFHFSLVLIGVNNYIITTSDNVNNFHIKKSIKMNKLFFMLLKNGFLLLLTYTIYGLLIVLSYHANEYNLSFLNNTVVNEYKVMLLLPNLGNYWYIFSMMFKDYYYSFLFLFHVRENDASPHFHVFLYPIPLFFRLAKTPLIYLKVMIAITLLFQPNITVNDIVYSMLLLAIDYEKTICTIPFAKLLMILLGNLSLFFVTINLWLRKNTGNANYAFFNQLVVFNITVSSIKFYIRVQTPTEQLEEGKCIVVSKTREKKYNLLNMLKETFA